MSLTDEQVVLLTDIASTGISGTESGGVKIGDAVAMFAQGPIGLCASLGAKLMGVEVLLDHRKIGVVDEIRRITGGSGVDVALEALGTEEGVS
jgi:alcohol dehydrogenase